MEPSKAVDTSRKSADRLARWTWIVTGAAFLVAAVIPESVPWYFDLLIAFVLGVPAGAFVLGNHRQAWDRGNRHPRGGE